MTAGSLDTDDCAFLGGKLLLRQMRSGHRAGTDACLLAAAVELRPGECVADVGAGVGAAGLAVLARSKDTRAVLIEREPGACTLARHNVAANGLAHRVRVAETSVFDRAAIASAGLQACADLVISNPPFFNRDKVRVSPDEGRAGAHVLGEGTHADWLRAMIAIAAPRGRLAMIHVPAVLPTLLVNWPAGWGGVRLRWVHPYAHRPATRVLITAVSGSRAPLVVAPPLILHDAAGHFTREADLAHRGLVEPST